MAIGSWIKFYRSFIKWEWYTDSNTKSVFIHLLLTANVEDKIYHGVLVRRGETITSYRSLSTSLMLSERQARTAIEHLKSTGEITSKIYNKFSLITIVNYEKYQDSLKMANNFDGFGKQGDKQSDKQTPENRQAESQATDKQSAGEVTTPKEYYNNRNKEGVEAAALPGEECDRKTQGSQWLEEWECDSDRILEAWNALGLQLITGISLETDRGKKLQRLIFEHGVDAVLQAIDNISRSVFLKGGGSKGWKITIDWFLNPDHFIRVLENRYEELWEKPADKTHPGKVTNQTAEARHATVVSAMADFQKEVETGSK